MKTIVTAIVMALVVVVSATASTTARDPRVPALQRRVATLEARMNEVVSVVNHNADVSSCRYVYQFKFNISVLTIFALMLGEPTPNITAPSDEGACQRAGIPTPTYLRQALALTR